MAQPYDEIPDRRRIVRRRTLEEALAHLVEDLPDGGEPPRPPVLALLRDALTKGRAEIRRRFEEPGPLKNDGPAVLAATSYLMDQIIRVLFDFADQHAYPAANPSAAERLGVVATGGYGRGELAPLSDIDLLFLRPYKQTPRGEQIVEFMLYLLWDLGLKVGHATRTVDESLRYAERDQTIRTALLEARYLWGDRALFDELQRGFALKFYTGDGRDFVDAKLAERDQRHHRMGDSRYVVEPNVKEGKGGLRDLHLLFWIAKYLYRVSEPGELVAKGVLTKEEARHFERAERFLSTVRCHIHYLTGRADDRLSFDLQREIATRLGYQDRPGSRGVERFTKHYYLHAKTVGDLTRIFVAALEDSRRRKPKLAALWQSLRPRELEGFRLDGERLAVTAPDSFAKDPVAILRLFHVAQENDLDIHPATLRLITQNIRLVDRLRNDPEANRLFMEMLTSRHDPETTLRRLNEAGVFGRFVPDFGRVVAQTQHDMYHTYTVDEHTIRAIGILSKIESGVLKEDHPLSADVVHKILSRPVLYLAVLLHDIAKGRGGDHSILGADVAMQLGPRLGLSAAETETVAWLVRYHLAMSATSFQRDLMDPKTIETFAALIQSPERLRLLLVLTVCDIRAVGPNVWNNWKAALLRQLYNATEQVLSGGTLSGGRAERIKHIQAEVAKRLPGWSDADKEAHFARGYASYWLSFPIETLVRQAELVRGAERGKQPLAIEHRVDEERSVTEVTIYTLDTHGLFARLAGAMAISGANIVDAKIFTLANGMALDTFWIQDLEGKPFDGPQRLARLAARVELALSNRLDIQRELDSQRGSWPKRDRVFTVEPRALIDNNASDAFTVIEVNGRDRPGFLHVVTRALTRLNLQIATAHVTTYGERAVDVFYIKDLFGLKVVHPDKLKQISAAVEAAIRDFDSRFDPVAKAAE
ncbi:[protein-PII] uridylyltransferase [Reyranella sp.]|jgi:[protein-PII] uridylyltransferase|uniref:[protein-PII] uridylyltransferase n=1 Tax=Reyranella sp. TaxID=1929291 RepID=UPI000BCFAFFD|nr:[protein-PII] uridylyltransferase [Reyranella sp.]OYY43089.1 MAG: [protein-PII] uridylyltransferase [Rhodospirillales bacterium 35-66-84]OYZ95058.1 MAG: [protein-PII] uridylyltransferase [Rhodospirillales bacterium 24-66-33]OZB26498.1 MAG: [protein-PII] uridylyltransferase [Rhodospirillales bacterium 39-66-50]HQS15910.1 [protein-PII] uridylyltransferase [Reyranella sp.]HQT13176.1 [protein-PII] uridylyltransferase [Reyranella sp.]